MTPTLKVAALAAAAGLWAAPAPAQGRTIVLGQCCDLHGRDAAFARGLRLAFDEINAGGGIDGRRVDLVQADDGGDPKRALARTRRFVEADRVALLIGYGIRSASPEVLALAAEHRIPFYASPAPRPSVQPRAAPFVFHLRPRIEDEVARLVAVLAGEKDLVRIACLHPSDADGRACRKLLATALAARHLGLAAAGSYRPGTTDVRAAFEAIAGKPVQAVVMFGPTPPCARFVTLVRGRRSLDDVVCAGTSAADPKRFAADLGGKADGSLFTTPVPFPWEPWLPVQADYVAAMKKAGLEARIGFASLEGYLAARLLAEVVVERIGDGPLRLELGPGLRDLGRHAFDGLEVRFGKGDHVGLDRPWVVRCIAGEVEEVLPAERIAPAAGK